MVFLLQFSLVFARWNRRLAHESISSKLVKKMPIAFDRNRHCSVFNMASLAQVKSEASEENYWEQINWPHFGGV